MTDEEKARVLAMLERGTPVKRIARETGIHRSTIWHFARSPIDRDSAKSIVDWLIEPRNARLSDAAVARRLEISRFQLRAAKTMFPYGPTTTLKIADLRMDDAMQPRAEIDGEAVERYAQDIVNGATFPPVTVFYDGDQHWLADGYHRIHAHYLLKRPEIECDVHMGGRRDAIKHALGANATHGIPRKRADIQRAIRICLLDEEWTDESDREVGRICSVNHETVGRIRKEMEEAGQITHPPGGGNRHLGNRRTGKDGKSYPSKPIKSKPPSSNGAQPAPSAAAVAVVEDDDDTTAASALAPVGSANGVQPAPDREPGSDDDAGEAPVAVAPAVSEEQRYLESLPIRAKLSERCRLIFDRDALKHRKAQAWLAEGKRLGFASGARSGELSGAWELRAATFIRTAFPAAWLLCLNCKGGHGDRGGIGCTTCHGLGYVVQ